MSDLIDLEEEIRKHQIKYWKVMSDSTKIHVLGYVRALKEDKENIMDYIEPFILRDRGVNWKLIPHFILKMTPDEMRAEMNNLYKKNSKVIA